MSGSLAAWQAVGVALACGLLIGAERERSADPDAVAGVRTFALAAVAGCVAALSAPPVGAVVVAAVALVSVAAAWRRAALTHGVTTEIALLVALGLGALAPRQPAVAAGVAVAVTVLLASKAELHRFVRQTVSEVELTDALRFAVAAFIVLPLLPSGPQDRLAGIDPRRVWLLVVLITGVGWAAYVAVRVLGARRGLVVAALAGGFVSGAATTGAMAARARDPRLRAAAIAAACVVSVATLVQLVVVVAVAAPSLVAAFVPAALGGSAVLLAEAWLVNRRASGAEQSVRQDADQPSSSLDVLSAERPLALRPALVLAVVITAVTLLARALDTGLGSGGVALAGAVGGLADAHAAALSVTTLAEQGRIGAGAAIAATGAGLATNTVVKIGLAAVSGGPAVAVRIAVLLAPAALTVGILLAAGLRLV